MFKTLWKANRRSVINQNDCTRPNISAGLWWQISASASDGKGWRNSRELISSWLYLQHMIIWEKKNNNNKEERQSLWLNHHGVPPPTDSHQSTQSYLSHHNLSRSQAYIWILIEHKCHRLNLASFCFPNADRLNLSHLFCHPGSWEDQGKRYMCMHAHRDMHFQLS